MQTQVPFLDLRVQYQSLKPEIEKAVCEVLASAQYALGPAVSSFEEAFAEYCQTSHAVAVNTGTSALHLAMLAADIGEGDEVITVSMTFVATVAAILYAGATPKFVDIDPDTWTMDVSQIEAAITPRTKAIVPVHLYGRMADMDPILEIARKHGLIVIEDAAQAHGAEYKGRRAGSLGHLGCFSFYPGKNLGACGEGGAVVTNSDAMAERIKMLRDWGQAGRYNHVVKGFNYRMDGIQGAVLGIKLKHLDHWIAERRRVAARYLKALAELEGIKLPAPMADAEHVWHVFSIQLADRDRVQKALSDAGVATGLHYPVPVHLQPAYADLGYGKGELPVAELLARETLSLPIFPELADAKVDLVCRALKSACGGEIKRVHAA